MARSSFARQVITVSAIAGLVIALCGNGHVQDSARAPMRAIAHGAVSGFASGFRAGWNQSQERGRVERQEREDARLERNDRRWAREAGAE